MDIKLKSIKYSNVTKGIAVFVIWICAIGIALSTWFLLYNQEILTTGNYYETNGFTSEYSRLIYNVTELKVKYHEEEGTAVSTATPITETPNKESIISIKSRLANTVNFAYYIKNLQTGEIITNVNDSNRLALLQKQPTYVYIGKGEPDTSIDYNKQKPYYKISYYSDDISKMLEGTPYEVHTAIVEPLKHGDIFYEQSTHYIYVRSIMPAVVTALVVSMALILIALIYLIYVAGRNKNGGEIALNLTDKIYTDVHTLLVFIAAAISLGLISAIDNSFGMTGTIIGVLIIFSIDVFIGISYILSMARQIKNRQILKNSLACKLYNITANKLYNVVRAYVIMAFSGKLFKPWMLLALLGYGLVNGILFSFLAAPYHGNEALIFIVSGMLIIVFNITAVYYAAKALANLIQIMEAVKEISVGNLDYELNKDEISVAFLGLAKDLQNLQKGLKSAVSEAVKGERMKTELITNVSHDLKTPLTSIINYVDLLKSEKMDNGNAKEYVAVLEEKSARLKQLVEDLIEASKASSGNLSINAEKINLHQLVMQAYGEYEEKLENKGLDMRINAVEAEILINADGKHLWRIVENLLSNVLKYSMPKSRVYVSLDKNDQYGILTIKNISAFPLEISPQQLTERFVRGDASRSTDGSGLGLSIAQSLTQLQGGNFKLEIDGDLFKVSIEVPLWVGI